MWSTPEELKGIPPAPPVVQAPCVVLPCCEKDQHLALNLLKWIAELGKVNTDLFLLCSKDCNVQALRHAGEMAFMRCTWMEDAENVKSDWREGGLDASGTNSLWKQAAFGMYLIHKKPFLWLEADAVPVCEGWWDKLVAEYRSCGRALMGGLLDGPNARHMSGVAFYSHLLPEKLPEMVGHNLGGKAFDMACPEKTLQYAHITSSIVDEWRNNMGVTADMIRPGTLLYHCSKDGRLIEELRRKRKGGDASCLTGTSIAQSTAGIASALHVPSAPVSSSGAPTFNPKAAPVVDIYLKTWSRDHELADLLLKSINKFVTGYRGLIIDSDTPLPTAWLLDYPITQAFQFPDKQPGYLWQQARKLDSHNRTDAQYMLWVDSDCCFNRPVDVSEFFDKYFFTNGKTRWRYTPLNLARPDQSSTWVPVMRKFLGVEPQHEFMREHPTLVPRWLLEEMEKFCLYRHGMALGDYVMAQADPANPLALNFSEINCAGFFAWQFHRDKFEWVPDDQAKPCLVQGFTWAGPERIAEDIAKHKAILGLDQQAMHAALQFSERGADPMTLDNVLSFLKGEAERSPLHKARLMKRITSALAAPKTVKTSPAKKKPSKEPKPFTDKGFLLCIHTYPGANDGLKRHWPNFLKAGAKEVIVITTKDGKCELPEGAKEIQIGDNTYINGPVLPQRLLDTIRLCLSTPYDRYAIAEWDCVILKPLEFTETSLHLTGGQVPGATAPYFFHNPWLFTRKDALRIADELELMIRGGDCAKGKPDASPDLALGLAIHRAKIEYKQLPVYSRNNLGESGALEQAIKAVKEGVVAVHGCKSREQYEALMNA